MENKGSIWLLNATAGSVGKEAGFYIKAITQSRYYSLCLHWGDKNKLLFDLEVGAQSPPLSYNRNLKGWSSEVTGADTLHGFAIQSNETHVRAYYAGELIESIEMDEPDTSNLTNIVFATGWGTTTTFGSLSLEYPSVAAATMLQQWETMYFNTIGSMTFIMALYFGVSLCIAWFARGRYDLFSLIVAFMGGLLLWLKFGQSGQFNLLISVVLAFVLAGIGLLFRVKERSAVARTADRIA